MSAAAAIPQEQVETLFTLWTRGETEERDSISVKKIYIDINDGYLADGVLFSQIMYWHGTDKKGKSRLSILRDGHLWLAKTYDEWLEECRIPARNAREAINRMVKRGLIEKFRWHFNGVPTIHIRVIHERFIELVMKYDPSLIRQNMSDKQEAKPPIRQKMSDGFDKKRQIQVTENVNSYNTETTTKTTAEGRKRTSKPPATPRPQDAIFNAIRDHICNGKGDNAGLGWEIGSYKSALLAEFPDITAEDIQRFAAWYKTQRDHTGQQLVIPGHKKIAGWFRKWRDSVKARTNQHAEMAGESPSSFHSLPSWIKPLRGEQ